MSHLCRANIAYVASVSVGFQSTERPKNEILIILPRKKWERMKNGARGRGEGGRNYGTKNGVGGRGEEGKETLASKGRYFEKPRSPANGEISASDWCGILCDD